MTDPTAEPELTTEEQAAIEQALDRLEERIDLLRATVDRQDVELRALADAWPSRYHVCTDACRKPRRWRWMGRRRCSQRPTWP